MTAMTLGAPVVSPSRLQVRQLVVFAEWEDEQALEDFLTNDRLGRVLADGWHIRLDFLRRWGHVEAFGDLPESVGDHHLDEPVVAVTLARLKHPQLVRFIRWGRPVERLVRDHPGATIALAAMRPVRTVSTFSMWSSGREMADMVRGHGSVPDPARHAVAMAERDRKDFHFEFTTLRFRSLGEHGSWEGRSGLALPLSPALEDRPQEA